ncbi:MAG: hypothetical protein HWN66_07935 [Candidatus Helarchaeota archaeon]|nr:hypothetical protein [Candidatus Helarchaeota archaeon]
MSEEKKPENCPKCGSPEFIFDPFSGETVCWKCNYVEKSKEP